MSISVLASADPELVMGQASDLLAGDPVGHNVVGTKLADAIRYGEPGRYWIGLLDGAPAGIAVQQPADAPLAVAAMPAELVAAIAAAVDADDVALPGVFGQAETASRFAEALTGLRKIAAIPTSAERLYEVRNVRFPDGVDGSLRPAAETDRELLLSWLPGFEAAAGRAGTDPAAVFVTRRLAAGYVWIWDNDGAVSMAARTDAVAGVARIQAVNTPPELRRRGYASASVAALSADVLVQGLRCVLSANVNNVAANSVYQRLGYQPVIDMLRYQLALGVPPRDLSPDARELALQRLPGEACPAGFVVVRQVFRVEDDGDPAATQRRDAHAECRVPGEGGVRPGHGDNRQAETDRLVQQPERQGVADPGSPLVDRVESGRDRRERAGRRQDVRRIRVLEADSHGMARHLGNAAGVEEPRAFRSGDDAGVPLSGQVSDQRRQLASGRRARSNHIQHRPTLHRDLPAGLSPGSPSANRSPLPQSPSRTWMVRRLIAGWRRTDQVGTRVRLKVEGDAPQRA